MPPDVVCTACGSTDPGYEFTPVSGQGVVRSWTVVRQSFLPGFDGAVHARRRRTRRTDRIYALVGRLLGGGDAQPGSRHVRVAFEDLADGFAVPAFELAE